MKKLYYIFTILAIFTISGYTFGQEKDVLNPLLKYDNEKNELKFTIGGRFIGDASWYNTEFTPMKSGASIVDARIRTSLTYKDLYFYADFDFSKGEFKQKNIFLRYNFAQNNGRTHSLKVGYFAEPISMSYNTSIYNYHFISRPTMTNALSPGRALGISYKFYNDYFLLDQGVFTENKYNDQEAGSQGLSVTGRWVAKLINNQSNLLHIGLGARYARMNTGYEENGVFKTHQILSSSLQTYTDPVANFLSADLPWAKENLDLSAEALFKTDKFFARGEYTYKKVFKKRPDEELFQNQLGGAWSMSTLESWQAANQLRASKFQGAYLELGYLLMGDKYSYNHEYGLLNGMNDKNSLEIVARYSYVDLNDINKGDMYLIGNNKFYPNGEISDYPPVSSSVAGGSLHAFTIGLNYTFNEYIKVMGEYQYGILDNVRYPKDENFHSLQMRVMFSF